jgi:hypothetical protein
LGKNNDSAQFLNHKETIKGYLSDVSNLMAVNNFDLNDGETKEFCQEYFSLGQQYKKILEKEKNKPDSNIKKMMSCEFKKDKICYDNESAQEYLGFDENCFEDEFTLVSSKEFNSIINAHSHSSDKTNANAKANDNKANNGMTMRALLEAPPNSAISDLSPNLEQCSNSMVLDLDVPGFDSASQMCSLYLGVDYSKCNIMQLQTQIKGDSASSLCADYIEGTLPTTMNVGLGGSLQDPEGLSRINGVSLLDITVDGCDKFIDAIGGGRRLLDVAPHDYLILVTQKVIISSTNGTGLINVDRFKTLSYYTNTTTWVTMLAGGGYVDSGIFSFKDYNDGRGPVLEIGIIIKNVTVSNSSKVLDDLRNSLHINSDKGDSMFFEEINNGKLTPAPKPSSSSPSPILFIASSSMLMVVFNALAALAFSSTLLLL